MGLVGEAADVLLPSMARDSRERHSNTDAVEVAGWDINLYAYVLGNPINFTDSTGLSRDTYHADRYAHGGPHVDRRNPAGQTVGRYRLDGSPIGHKGRIPPPIPGSDLGKFKEALKKLGRGLVPTPGLTTYDTYCRQHPEDCVEMFGDLPPVDAGPPKKCTGPGLTLY
jgi:hypothetical protein